MKISVVVCTYNREKYIAECLEHLKNQDYAVQDFEIVIINNNSTDHTDAICNNFLSQNPDLNINYIIEKRQGLSNARNTGLNVSKGDIIVFIDDDAFAVKEYLKEVERIFREHPDAIAAGGKVVPVFEGEKPAWMSKFLLPLVAALDFGQKVIPVPKGKFPIGANMMFRKQAFDLAGVFDPDLGRTGSNLLGGEEKDLFNRLRSLNRLVMYSPTAVVDHIVPQRRVEMDYIKRQASGIGISERLRVKKSGLKGVVGKLISEAVKAAGTLLLAIYYLFTLQPQKGIFLVRFRIWVLKGFLSGK